MVGRRIAPALVTGWLLMHPPFQDYVPDKPIKWYGGEPVQKWTQLGAFDTARECEAERGQEQARMVAAGKKLGGDHEAAWLGLATTLRCVPADHVYPSLKE